MITSPIWGERERAIGRPMADIETEFAALEARTKPPHRALEREIMDEPDLPEDRARALYDGLDTAARRAGIYRLASLALLPLCAIAEKRRGAPVHVLDVGCGGGQVCVAIAKLAKRFRLPIHVIGTDYNAFALKLAEERAARAGVEVQFVQGRADARLPGCEVAVCTLALHHLSPREAVGLFDAMEKSASVGALIADGSRHPVTQFAMKALLLGIHPDTVHDGKLSMRRCYSAPELDLLLSHSKLGNFVRRAPLPFFTILAGVRPK